MDWLEIAVAADDEAVDAVADVLRRYGQGVAIEEPFVQPSLDDEPRRDLTRRPVVKTYIPTGPLALSAQRQIEESLWHLGQLRNIETPQVRLVPEEDWANAWKPFFPVLHIGQRTVVAPSWRRYRARPSDIVIRLDPGMAFGTGMHPTTRLCLEALESIATDGNRVLDVGTGSGILAIAAARLGARTVVGIDNDPVAVTAARENVRRNRLTRVIMIHEGTLPDSAPTLDGGHPLTPTLSPTFDLILANVTARVNTELAVPMASLLTAGGLLLASGILADSADQVCDAFAVVGLEVTDRQYDGDWALLIASREP